MKKLYLTSFTFIPKESELSITDYRLVVVTLDDMTHVRKRDDVSSDVTSAELGLQIAQEKAAKWFPENFSESSLISITACPAIDFSISENALKEPVCDQEVVVKGFTDLPHSTPVFELRFIDDFKRLRSFGMWTKYNGFYEVKKSDIWRYAKEREIVYEISDKVYVRKRNTMILL